LATLCLNNPIITDKGHLPDSLAGTDDEQMLESKVIGFMSVIVFVAKTCANLGVTTQGVVGSNRRLLCHKWT